MTRQVRPHVIAAACAVGALFYLAAVCFVRAIWGEQ